MSIRRLVPLNGKTILFSLHSFMLAFRETSPKKGSLSFTHPQVVPNPYEFISSVEHKRRYFEECW